MPIAVGHSLQSTAPGMHVMQHPTHTLGIVTRGDGCYRSGPWEGPIAAPSLGFLPAGEDDGNGLHGEWESWFCCFHWPEVECQSLSVDEVQVRLPGAELQLRRQLPVDAVVTARVVRQFHQLKSTLEQPGAAAQIRAAGLLLEMLLDYTEARRSASDRQGHRSLAAFHELLQTHACEPMSLRDMSTRSGLSVDDIRDIIVREFGTTPQQYRLGLRLAQGRDLLTHGHTVREAADHCGFADASYFSRAFLKQFGIRPTALIRHCAIR